MKAPGRRFLFLLVGLSLTLLSESLRAADFSFSNTPLKKVISEVREETGYFFLYRESLIRDIDVTLNSDETAIFDDLNIYLAEFGISLTTDHNRKQVLITHLTDTDRREVQNYVISGQVVDNQSGERLPFATITWIESGKRKGVASNHSGQFSIVTKSSGDSIELNVSYLGFESKWVRLQTTDLKQSAGITIRLEPEPVQSNEIVISGNIGYNPADTLSNRLMDAARFSPLGESNSIRALQSHPSVTSGTAINNGINVRGSTPDGFMVQLDGLSVFNQSHLFGLLDSFNPDAIQNAGYYYGISPAQIDTPTGGSLHLITRTGSLNEIRGSAGLSNTAINSTFEGPLGTRGSWLISGRASLMDQLPWFNNSRMIRWGLDIDRPKKIAGDFQDFTDLVLNPGESSAFFGDIHTKIYLENRDATRWIFSGYFGGDYTRQEAERRARTPESGSSFTFQPVQTTNEWGNVSFSIQHDKEFSNRIFSTSQAGFSSYRTDFNKEDYVYTRLNTSDETDNISVFTYPFQNRSTMNEFKVNQEFEYSFSNLKTIGGAGWKYYLGEYSEFSFDRPSYFQNVGSHMVQAYLQNRYEPFDFIELHAGLRSTYYTLNNEFYFSPRGKVVIKPIESFRFTGGYSINQQFLHRITIENSATSDVWILTPENQQPAEAKQITAGIQFTPSNRVLLQVEAYQKEYKNLRSHELNTQSLANTFSQTPWFYQNSGKASGIEFLLRNYFGRLVISQTYTLSEMTFSNPFLLDGEDFYADWDRRHSYNAILETNLWHGLNLYLSWLMMSGAPNKLNIFQDDTVERLDSYQRLDATLSYSHQFQNQNKFEATLSVFNLLDRENVWYRNYAFSFDETRSVPRLTPVPVDVLDLGFQPSFSVKYTF
ncbi:TonB-dependent receptor [Rhodohalobacter halophilus]|uniref:TonB-dependent receptor n=1 Tax=Rhodohalobacter halophilus TaxID=1812810 RepID=UPI00083FB442|nr:TonB-dependent receptor [Rhodohalobacter halophilus]